MFGAQLTAICLSIVAATTGCSGNDPAAAPHENRAPRIVAYVAGWSMPQVIHAQKLTHVNFAFAHIDAGGRAGLRDPSLAAALESLLSLKRDNPALGVIVSVGGWQAEGFSDAAFTADSRRRFAGSVVDLVRRHRVDGIDLDWEYPGQGAGGIKYRAEDKQNFTHLLAEVRRQLDAASDADGRSGAARYVLTIASADREYFDHTEMERLHVHLDWINVMTYDFFNSLTPTTGHHAGLYASERAAPADRNADAAIRQHLAAGIAPGKLVLGVAFYGRGFAGVHAQGNGVNQKYEKYEGDHPYRELASGLIGRQGYERYWDERARAPYLWNAATRTFITYDDAQSIGEKADYVRAKDLGGIMFWELSQDRDDELLDVIVKRLKEARP